MQAMAQDLQWLNAGFDLQPLSSEVTEAPALDFSTDWTYGGYPNQFWANRQYPSNYSLSLPQAPPPVSGVTGQFAQFEIQPPVYSSPQGVYTVSQHPISPLKLSTASDRAASRVIQSSSLSPSSHVTENDLCWPANFASDPLYDYRFASSSGYTSEIPIWQSTPSTSTVNSQYATPGIPLEYESTPYNLMTGSEMYTISSPASDPRSSSPQGSVYSSYSSDTDPSWFDLPPPPYPQQRQQQLDSPPFAASYDFHDIPPPTPTSESSFTTPAAAAITHPSHTIKLPPTRPKKSSSNNNTHGIQKPKRRRRPRKCNETQLWSFVDFPRSTLNRQSAAFHGFFTGRVYSCYWDTCREVIRLEKDSFLANDVFQRRIRSHVRAHCVASTLANKKNDSNKGKKGKTSDNGDNDDDDENDENDDDDDQKEETKPESSNQAPAESEPNEKAESQPVPVPEPAPEPVRPCLWLGCQRDAAYRNTRDKERHVYTHCDSYVYDSTRCCGTFKSRRCTEEHRNRAL